ncbi:hypothetical protein [Amycolatopsis bartoniae]|uniref:hypothetical protein n=1 Tax=Amycolatopsis bartoniae TaxID=941986 RepID=UPI00288C4EA7|nr:hypothetical protein [Amycolatopsis bartoniae]
MLVVDRKATPAGSGREFGVFDQHGDRLGAVVEIGRGLLRKALHLFPNCDQFLTSRFEVRDAGGSVVLKVTRPAKMVPSRFLVTRADGTPIGEISRESTPGRIRFAFTARGRPVGQLHAERDFSITDADGLEVAHGAPTADNYVVEVHDHLSDPLASMVVAAALTVDTALKQAGHDT